MSVCVCVCVCVSASKDKDQRPTAMLPHSRAKRSETRGQWDSVSCHAMQQDAPPCLTDERANSNHCCTSATFFLCTASSDCRRGEEVSLCGLIETTCSRECREIIHFPLVKLHDKLALDF